VISVLSPTIISLKLIDTSRRLKRIIFLSSQYAQVAQIPSLYDKPELALSSVYSALKGAVLSLARALSIGAIAKGINVNVFTVGGIRESTGEILAQRIEEKIPSSGMLSAPEVARAIVHISEVFGLGMVGSNVVIDGGWTAI
jgi:NAD(P)-dependent dehydrogenase (short-subunit alcohol dehydrogenase family)